MAPIKVSKENKENQFRTNKKRDVLQGKEKKAAKNKIPTLKNAADIHRENIPPLGINVPASKRLREKSPNDNTITKRSAFGDLTNVSV